MSRIPRLPQWILSVVLFFFIMLGIFRLVFYWHYSPTEGVWPGNAFLMGARLDARIVGILGLVMLLLCALPFLNPFRRKGAAIFWNVLLTIVFLALFFLYIIDFFHYDYLQQRLNASVLNYLQDAGISMNMVWETYPVIRALLLVIVLGALAYFAFSRLLRFFTRRQSVKLRRSGLWTIPLVLLFLAGVWGTFGQFALRWSDVYTLNDAFRAQLALNPVQSFFSTLSFKNSAFNADKAREHYRLMSGYLGLPHRDSASLQYARDVQPAPMLPVRPNIVLVICESFSAYKSSMWGNPLNATPYFDSLARSGVFFDHCFTPTNGTARGVWATITGIPDVNMPKTSSRNPALVEQHTIINDFKGYERLYFLGGSASWANIRGVLSYNIDSLRLYEQEDYEAEQIDVWGVSDKNLLLHANDVLAKETKPFFAIIQTADNHRPYTIPEEDLDEFRKLELPEDSLKRYGFFSNPEYNAFRYTDFSFRKFMEAARKSPYFNNTIFVFVGDHGIRGDAGGLFPEAWSEQALTTFHVPLLFYSPLLQPSRHNRICSQLDILPSIASLAGVPYRNTTLGRNLFDSAAADVFRASSAFIFDPDEQTIGMVAGDHYFRKYLGKGLEQLVSIRNNSPVPKTVADSVKGKLARYAEAFYETSRYMLYHNRKQ